MWPQYERVIRQIAGLGQDRSLACAAVRIRQAASPDRRRRRRRRAGRPVRRAGGGGSGRAGRARRRESVPRRASTGFRARRRESSARRRIWRRACAPQSNIRILANATAFGFYEGGMLGIFQGRREIRLRTKRLVLASGVIERPMVFGNNDLPGVMLGRAVQRLHPSARRPAGLARRRRRQQCAIDAGRGGSRGGRRRNRRLRRSARADRRDRRRQVAARPAGDDGSRRDVAVRARFEPYRSRVGGVAFGVASADRLRPARARDRRRSGDSPGRSRPALGAGTTRTGMRFWPTSGIRTTSSPATRTAFTAPTIWCWMAVVPAWRRRAASARRADRPSRACRADALLVRDQCASGAGRGRRRQALRVRLRGRDREGRRATPSPKGSTTSRR